MSVTKAKTSQYIYVRGPLDFPPPFPNTPTSTRFLATHACSTSRHTCAGLSLVFREEDRRARRKKNKKVYIMIDTVIVTVTNFSREVAKWCPSPTAKLKWKELSL